MKNFLFLLFLSPLLLFSSPQVLVTIAPYKYVVQQIAGDTVDVQVLVPAGMSPHTFEPSAKELVKAGRSALWLRIGEPFEKKSISVLKDSNPTISIVDLRQGVIDCKESDSHCDNHIWLSVNLMKLQVKAIKEALVKIAPAHKELYEKRAALFLTLLDKMSRDFKELFTRRPTKALIVSHPAFGYFCRDYQIIQLSLEMEGREPTIKQINKLIDKARALKASKAILEPQYQNKGTLIVAKQLNLPVYTVDPYAENWGENMNYIAKTFAS